MTTTKTIAIIGAGACGVLVLTQLVERLPATHGHAVKLLLIEKGRDFGPGLAYSTPLGAHIVNMRVDTMSPFQDDPDHFVRWLRDSQKSQETAPLDRESFPPRKIYGDYLKDIFAGVLQKADAAGIQLECINDEAVALSRTAQGYRIVFRNLSPLTCHCAVLALGNFPIAAFSELENLRGYFHYPWPVESILQNISGDEPVAIIGSGLSAIDALFTLLAAGQKERVYFVSRNGWLPKVRSVLQPYELRFVSLENIGRILAAKKQSTLTLDQVVDLFFKEAEAAEGKSIDRSVLFNPKGSPLKILEADLAKAREKSIPYQNALIATEPIIRDIWHLMSVEDRRLFDHQYKSLWTVYRHPMPPINAEKILSILKSGQLQVLSGLKRIYALPSSGRFAVEMAAREGISQTLEVAAVINAAGQGCDIKTIDSDLIRNLLSEKVITPHPNGGINADFATGRILDREGNRTESLFALGELTRGVHFYTNGIAPCALRAKDIANFIVNRFQDASRSSS